MAILEHGRDTSKELHVRHMLFVQELSPMERDILFERFKKGDSWEEMKTYYTKPDEIVAIEKLKSYEIDNSINLCNYLATYIKLRVRRNAEDENKGLESKTG